MEVPTLNTRTDGQGITLRFTDSLLPRDLVLPRGTLVSRLEFVRCAMVMDWGACTMDRVLELQAAGVEFNVTEVSARECVFYHSNTFAKYFVTKTLLKLTMERCKILQLNGDPERRPIVFSHYIYNHFIAFVSKATNLREIAVVDCEGFVCHVMLEAVNALLSDPDNRLCVARLASVDILEEANVGRLFCTLRYDTPAHLHTLELGVDERGSSLMRAHLPGLIAILSSPKCRITLCTLGGESADHQESLDEAIKQRLRYFGACTWRYRVSKSFVLIGNLPSILSSVCTLITCVYVAIGILSSVVPQNTNGTSCSGPNSNTSCHTRRTCSSSARLAIKSWASAASASIENPGSVSIMTAIATASALTNHLGGGLALGTSSCDRSRLRATAQGVERPDVDMAAMSEVPKGFVSAAAIVSSMMRC